MRHKPCYLFIVLTNKCLWTNFHFRYICVLVQHMDVIVWWDAVDALAFQRCSTLFAAHDLGNLNISFKNRIMTVYQDQSQVCHKTTARTVRNNFHIAINLCNGKLLCAFITKMKTSNVRLIPIKMQALKFSPKLFRKWQHFSLGGR